jgi:hypothetical protein
MSYSLCNYVLQLMEMAGKQFSPFIEQLVQLCLTGRATMSYRLWKWLASSSSPFMELLVEVCLTAYTTLSYRL